MALSAFMSFIACILLGITAIIALKRSNDSRYIGLAFVSILLAVSEFLKGIEWKSIGNGVSQAGDMPVLANMFLTTAILPWYLPTAFLMAEHNPWRRKKLKMLLFIGICVSLYFTFNLIKFDAWASGIGTHFSYHIDIADKSLPVLRIFYIIPVLLPCFISGMKRAYPLGMSFVISYILSLFYFEDDFPQMSSLLAVLSGFSVLWIIWGSSERRSGSFV